jgi:hypothetical protein
MQKDNTEWKIYRFDLKCMKTQHESDKIKSIDILVQRLRQRKNECNSIQCVSLGNIQWNKEWTRLTRDNIDEMEQTLCDDMAYIPFLPSITKYTGYPLLSTIKQEQGEGTRCMTLNKS